MQEALPIEDFNISSVGVRKVQRDCHIVVDNNYYSVPYKYVGEDVEIELDNKLLRIFYDNQIIVTHVRCINKGQFITNKAHYPKYKLYEIY